jgi:hypothetical protein
VLYKEFMPVFHSLLPSTAGAESGSGGAPAPVGVGGLAGPPTVCGCLVAVASMMADALGWSRNPSFLVVVHERFFQFTMELERLVGHFAVCSCALLLYLHLDVVSVAAWRVCVLGWGGGGGEWWSASDADCSSVLVPVWLPPPGC